MSHSKRRWLDCAKRGLHCHHTPNKYLTIPPPLHSSPHNRNTQAQESNSPNPLHRHTRPTQLSTVCAAVGDWAAWMFSGSRCRSRAWPRCGCGCAGTGSWSWQTTWSSGDTCGAWPRCGSWRGSACRTCWRTSLHTSDTWVSEGERQREEHL